MSGVIIAGFTCFPAQFGAGLCLLAGVDMLASSGCLQHSYANRYFSTYVR